VYLAGVLVPLERAIAQNEVHVARRAADTQSDGSDVGEYVQCARDVVAPVDIEDGNDLAAHVRVEPNLQDPLRLEGDVVDETFFVEIEASQNIVDVVVVREAEHVFVIELLIPLVPEELVD